MRFTQNIFRALRANKAMAVLFAAGLLSLVVVACSTVDAVTGKNVRNAYLIEEDIDLGEKVLSANIEEMEKEGVRINQDKKRVAQLQEIVNRISAVSHMPDLPYEVVLFQTNIVNAAAAPGGKLMVFSGLYDDKDGLARDEDEIAAVIGHEVSHVTCRHTTESMTREMPIEMLFLIAGIVAQTQGNDDWAAAFAVGFLAYQGLILPKFSRTDESEADAVGIMYMAKAGYDPRAAPRIWKRAHEKSGDNRFLNLISTHPASKARYESLERLLPAAMDEYAKVKGGYPADWDPTQHAALR